MHPLHPALPDLHHADPREMDRLAKLGRAIVAMSRHLADSRRELAELRRENDELRRTVLPAADDRMAQHRAAESCATPDAVGRLRHWLEDVCTAAGTPDPVRADAVLAASEALSNVAMHAYVDRGLPGAVRIRARVDDVAVHVEVEDDGVGIGPRIDSPGAGLGLALIASLASSLELVHARGGIGTRVRMSFESRPSGSER